MLRRPQQATGEPQKMLAADLAAWVWRTLRPVDQIPIVSYTRLAGSPSGPQTRCGSDLGGAATKRTRRVDDAHGFADLTPLLSVRQRHARCPDTPPAGRTDSQGRMDRHQQWLTALVKNWLMRSVGGLERHSRASTPNEPESRRDCRASCLGPRPRAAARPWGGPCGRCRSSQSSRRLQAFPSTCRIRAPTPATAAWLVRIIAGKCAISSHHNRRPESAKRSRTAGFAGSSRPLRIFAGTAGIGNDAEIPGPRCRRDPQASELHRRRRVRPRARCRRPAARAARGHSRCAPTARHGPRS